MTGFQYHLEDFAAIRKLSINA